MANTLTGLFETLVVPATVEAVQALRYSKAAAESVFWDYKGTGGRIGQTLNCNIPKVNESDAADIGSGPLQPSDTDHDVVPITLSSHPSVSFVIKTWDDVRTPQEMARVFMKPKLEALQRKINRSVTSLFTSANFSFYSGITGGTDTFTRANLTKAWSNLVSSGVPVFDTGNLFFLTSPLAYGNMMADTNFYQESVVGINVAEILQRRATFAPQLNAVVKFDQQMLVVGGKQTAAFFHRYAVGGIMVTPPSLASMGGSGVEETTIYPFANAPDFPVQLQMQPSVKDQGTIIHMHAMYGLRVVRPDHGQYLVGA